MRVSIPSTLAAAVLVTLPVHGQDLLREFHRPFLSAPRPQFVTLWFDADGDGDLDAYQGYFSGASNFGGIVINRGGGEIVYEAQRLSGLPYSGAVGGEVADFDGNGSPDLLLWGRSVNPVQILSNDGSGFFTATPAPSQTCTRAVVLDANGDGTPDLLIGHQTTQTLVLYLNDGSAGFTSAPGTLPWGLPQAAGDVDGDGDDDVLTSTGLFFNDGTGAFAVAPSVACSAPFCFLADLDGDGDLDALGVRNGTLQPVLVNDGSGSFEPVPQTVFRAGIGPSGATLFDLGGDGDLDLYVTYTLCNDCVPGSWLLANDGTNRFVDLTGVLPAGLRTTIADGVSAADTDGDGDDDVVVSTFFPEVTYLFQTADGLQPETTTGLQASSGSLDLGDLDGDGDLDALLYGRMVFLNPGNGNPQPIAGAFPGINPAEAKLGDADGDGDLDALVFNIDFASSSDAITLFLNGGSGSFVQAPSQPTPTALRTEDGFFEDLDGDGDRDIYGTKRIGGTAVHLNDGTGVFSLAPVLTPGNGGTNVGVAFDLEGDGDLDVWRGYQISFNDVLHENDGAAVFSDASGQLPAGLQSTGLAAADVDLDGDVDVLTVANTALMAMQLNDGAGTFASDPSLVPSRLVRSAGFADVDGDGDPDLLVGERSSTPYGGDLYLNDGSGSFGGPAQALPGRTFDVFHAADIDQDGDLDIVTEPSISLFSGLERHLATVGPTRAGKPLIVELHGPPNGAWYLATADAPASFPTAFGQLQLDPATISLVTAGVLGPDGSGRMTFAAASVPSVIGLTLPLQAVVAAPARLTNREDLTLLVP